MSSRLEKLEAMFAADPTDTMACYMLATEVEKTGDTDRTLQLFDTLIHAEPPYVPAFLMAGQLLARLNRTDEARAVYTDGIQAAQLQGNDHAAGEMGQFLAELPG